MVGKDAHNQIVKISAFETDGTALIDGGDPEITEQAFKFAQRRGNMDLRCQIAAQTQPGIDQPAFSHAGPVR